MKTKMKEQYKMLRELENENKRLAPPEDAAMKNLREMRRQRMVLLGKDTSQLDGRKTLGLKDFDGGNPWEKKLEKIKTQASLPKAVSSAWEDRAVEANAASTPEAKEAAKQKQEEAAQDALIMRASGASPKPSPSKSPSKSPARKNSKDNGVGKLGSKHSLDPREEAMMARLAAKS